MPTKKRKAGTKRTGARGRQKGKTPRPTSTRKKDITGPQRILVVAIGRGNTSTDVYPANPAKPVRQAIIPGLGQGLDPLAQAHSYKFQIDYVDDEPGNPLKKRIRNYVTAYGAPAVVFPIASRATKMARAVFGSPSSVPMVFVVVSDAYAEQIVGPGQHVTGYSTMLLQMASECLRHFKQMLPNSLQTVHAIYYRGTHPTEAAMPQLQAVAKAVGVSLVPHRLPLYTGFADIQGVVNAIPDPPQAGLLMVPDDLVVSWGQDVIGTAYQKGIPTFVQVVEFVTVSDPSKRALAGFGMPGLAIGLQAADYVDKVIMGTSPDQLPVKPLSAFEWWASQSLVAHFSATVPASAGVIQKP